MIDHDHELRVHPPYFRALDEGRKNFEVRRDDRGFQTGQVIWLREYDTERQVTTGRGPYTGNALFARITYILTGGKPGIAPGFIVMGLAFEDDDFPNGE